MGKQSELRRLAAIVFTDIAGYTRMMDSDEQQARQMLKENRKITGKALEGFDGELLKEMGDGMLLMFSSVIQAVHFAKTLQETEKNFALRIGIHIGDVIIEDGDVFGSGVNVASRIEHLASPGGICVSSDVWSQVRNQSDISGRSLGRKELKGVSEAVEVYELETSATPLTYASADSEELATETEGEDRSVREVSGEVEQADPIHTSPSDPKSVPGAGTHLLKKLNSPAGYGFIALAGLVAVLFVFFVDGETVEVPVETVQGSIAVLPLENMSPDQDDAFFADVMHEDIIILLSQIGDIRPTARSSVLGFGSENRDLQQIAEELNVVSILEGNVRRAGNNIRVGVQLIDPFSHEVLWGNSYERDDITEVFEVQQAIAREIVSSLQANLTSDEVERLEGRPTEVAEAYEFYLQARELGAARSALNEDRYRSVINLLSLAIEHDPDFAQAHALLSAYYGALRWFGYDNSHEILQQFRHHAERALEINPESPDALRAIGRYYYMQRDFPQALEYYSRAYRIQPNNALSYSSRAIVERRLGKIEESIQNYNHAIALDPVNHITRFNIAFNYTLLRQYEEADRQYESAFSLNPDYQLAKYWQSYNRLIWKGDIEPAQTYLQTNEQIKTERPVKWVRLQFLVRDFHGILETVYEVPRDMYRGQFNLLPPSYFQGLAYDYLGSTDQSRPYYESALAEMEGLDSSIYEDDPRYRIGLGRIYAGLGRHEEAIRQGKEAVELLPLSLDAFDGIYYLEELAIIYAQLGIQDEAVDILEQLLTIPSRVSIQKLHVDPSWDPIRETTEFQELLNDFERDA